MKTYVRIEDYFNSLQEFPEHADNIILYDINEISNIVNLNKILRYYSYELKNKKTVHLFLNTSALHEPVNTRQFQTHIVDWFMLRTYYHNNFNRQWNSTSGTGLYLMGKPYHSHRATLLYYLTKTKNWDNITYSFNPCYNTLAYNTCIEIFEQIGADYGKFSEQHERTLDVPHSNTSGVDDYHYTGFPYNLDLYKDTTLSIIPETEINIRNKCIMLTEKTWKAIANKHPFIMIGTPGIESYLESRGYDTFSYMHYHANVNNSTDNIFDRTKKTAENVDYFLSNYHKFSDRIEEGTERNFQLFQKECLDTIDREWNSSYEKFIEFVENVKYPNLR